jgi:hypothetical protein
VSPAQFLPPDHSKGDERTVGGYAAVHARPAALEGPNGISYSLEILSDSTGDPMCPFGAYLLFVRWSRLGTQRVEGHLESDFLAWGRTAADAERTLGAMPLTEAQRVLDALIAADRGPTPVRRRLIVRPTDEETPHR